MATHDWKITAVTKVTDGDTIRVHYTRTVDLYPGLAAELHDVDAPTGPPGKPIRLIIIDPVEKGDPQYKFWGAKLAGWLMQHQGHLRVETQESAGWDRLLGDVYVEGERGNTATQFMLSQGAPLYKEYPSR